MFRRRLPILGEKILTRLPKPYTLTYAHSQTLRFFPPPPPSSLFPSFQSRIRTVVHSRDVSIVSGPLLEPETLPPELRLDLMPKHVAVIMDGNRRWAEMRGLPVSAGHEVGMQSMMKIIDLSCSWGIKVLTLFWFSCDNWKRPQVEVDFLMCLFERFANTLTETCNREGTKISVIGDTSKLPLSLQRALSNAEERTKQNCGLQLILAINYSSKYDVVQACKAVAGKVKDGILQVEDIGEELMEKELETNCTKFPSPDLMIRTSGEQRMSNFLLWQIAYTELVFDSHLWPEFGKDQFVEALALFQKRQRRFGARHS